jgi:glycosyltransferase involved in cell wall biosynthesis/2-polyprenyl-3-methyl-5-hydroxy-6-metoxy-1,4-benzoquinol methylase
MTDDRTSHARARLLILVVAYNAEKTITDVLGRIPARLAAEYDVEILVIDDASQDRTFEKSRAVLSRGTVPYPLHVLFNPVNQGYGGNQKIGYHFAIDRGFDFVALLHGDGQYAPECLPELVRPLRDGDADAVFGSRMLERGAAIRGGMPLYKFVGNRILSTFQNRMLGTGLSEFHSGYRVYATAALRRIPFALNTNDFHFDTEIIVQLFLAGQRVRELPIPTYYGDELCHVDGLRYAWDVTKTMLVARAQALGLFYDRRFDCAAAPAAHSHYELKLGYSSPHALALERVEPGSRVLDLGCAGGLVADLLTRRKTCRVTAVDRFAPLPDVRLESFVLHDLDQGPPALDFTRYDCVLLLDVLEHLRSPEDFVERLREAMAMAPRVKLLVSTANVGFFINRLALLLGQFNYGKRGVLDLTHTRLFTFKSFRRLFEQAGFRVVESRGVPGPFPLALGDNWLSRALVGLNQLLIGLASGLFSYQLFFVVEPMPSLEYLLGQALEHSSRRAESEEARVSASEHG